MRPITNQGRLIREERLFCLVEEWKEIDGDHSISHLFVTVNRVIIKLIFQNKVADHQLEITGITRFKVQTVLFPRRSAEISWVFLITVVFPRSVINVVQANVKGTNKVKGTNARINRY